MPKCRLSWLEERKATRAPMALHHYVQDKDEVLPLVQEQAQPFPRPELPSGSPQVPTRHGRNTARHVPGLPALHGLRARGPHRAGTAAATDRSADRPGTRGRRAALERAAPSASGAPDSAVENCENSHRRELEIILSGLPAGVRR
ncbi:hypothetical protein [Streptomyces sp. CLV115]|uniref:hypothetical protein n=1 Tax=Streptomyces sp. CLV115 TaxID=3138502 RepID=UPI00313B3484